MMNEYQRQVLRDALYEFMQRREPVEEYVAKRYASHYPDYRNWKILEVRRRIGMAKAMLQNFDSLADCDIPVVPTED